MSVLELLFALLLVCLIVGIGVVGFLVWNLSRSAEGHARDVAELKTRLQAGGQTQESQAAELRERLSQTQSVVEGLRSAISARQPVEEEARASLKRLESVIAGSSSRGASWRRPGSTRTAARNSWARSNARSNDACARSASTSTRRRPPHLRWL